MTAATPPSLDPTHDGAAAPVPSRAADDLREIIEAYHGVTERLQESHETLQREVLRLREQLASADAQLQRSKRLAALGEMAAGIAHEVRNPLAAIGLYAEMIAEDGTVLRHHAAGQASTLVGQVSENAGKIGDAVRGLSGIVNDVLNFSRPLEPRRQPLSVNELIGRTLDTHRPAIEQAAVNVSIPSADVAVVGDPDLLHQALLNLVRNAVDAMVGDGDDSIGKSSEKLNLTLSAERDATDPGTVNLTVADSGPGIDAAAVDRIFNPFFTTRSTGTGLGLAIVHRIVDAHGGSIAVRNDPATGGAVFTLSLPAPSPSSPAREIAA